MARRFNLSALCLLSLLLSSGCDTTTSNIPGPQLKDVPVGFGLDQDPQTRRNVLEHLPLLDRRAYFLRGDEGTASIVLTQYEGGLSESELEDLCEVRAEQWARSGVVFGDLEDVQIDNRDAWLWFERAERSRRLVAVIPFPEDDRTWTVDFYTSVGRFQDDELMRRHVTSFARDPKADERGPVTFGFFLFFAAAGLIAWYFRQRRQYKRLRPGFSQPERSARRETQDRES